MADERLHTFVTVVQCGSLTQAAKQLYISQPAVSRQIHLLEEDFHATLLHRHERGIALTPAGQRLYRSALRIQELYAEAMDDVAELTGELAGTLHIGATLTIGEYVLPPLMGKFKARAPRLNLLLEVENTQRIGDAVAAGTLDCGLIEGPFTHTLLSAERLAADELAVIASPQHPLAGHPHISLDAVQQEAFILREPGSGTRTVFEEALRRAGGDPAALNVLMQLGSTHAVKALVMQNLGISILSVRAIQQELAQHTLTILDVPALDLHRTFTVLLPKGTRTSPLTRAFILFCRREI